MANQDNLARKGGKSREKLKGKNSLENIINRAKRELLSIESTQSKQTTKTKKFTRLASKIRNALHDDGKKYKNEDQQISLSTYHGYLTRIRNELKALGIKHHSLLSAIARLSKKYPEYAPLFQQIIDKPALTVGAAKAHVMKEIQADKKGKHRGAAYKAVKLLKIDHDVITRLVKSDIQRADRAQNEAGQLKEKKQNAVTLNHQFIIDLISKLIQSTAYSRQALGLALASGRRAIEIVYTGNFDALSDNSVTFEGQAKKRRGISMKAYPIYTIIEPSDFLEAFKKFRGSSVIKEIHRDVGKFPSEYRNREVNKRIAKTLNETTKRAFNDKARVFKDSRAIYTRIALDHFFKGEEWVNKDEDEFLKSLLGHSDYKDQRNYKQFKMDYSKLDPVVIEEVEQVQPDSAALKHLNAINGIIAATDRKAMVRLHERIKAWAANNTEWKITKTVMMKPKGVGKIGGNRTLINDYILLAQLAMDKYNANK